MNPDRADNTLQSSRQTFAFLHYVNPIWYFNLLPRSAGSFATCFYDGPLNGLIPPELTIDRNYQTEKAVRMDLGYQAWHRGLMLETSLKHLQPLLLTADATPSDNYRFVRKYFTGKWSFLILFLRIITFHNPFKELRAMLSVRNNTGYIDLASSPRLYPQYDSFDSKLVADRTPVTVIIPTLNRYPYLRNVLLDLEKQTIPPAEVIITDQSEHPDREFYKAFEKTLNIRVVFQDENGQWLGRNAAIRLTDTDYLLFFDDDSSVAPNWIEEHLKGMDYFSADIIAGISISKVGDTVPRNYSYFRWADQFDSGNALVRRKVFETIGMFDQQYDKMRMGDGEFGLRAYLSGFRSISHPFAKRLHFKVPSGGLRQIGSWDGFRPKKWFAPCPVPSVIYFFRGYFPRSYAIWGVILGVLPSLVPYKYKSNRTLKSIGTVAMVFIWPIPLIRAINSWRKASRMLEEGPKIPFDEPEIRE